MTGMGVMIGMLGGNEGTVTALRSALSATIPIKTVAIIENVLRFDFQDGSILRIWDDGQSCCESRYMRTDDNLDDFVGSTLLDFELADAPSPELGEYDEAHEIQFLRVKTDRGVLTVSNHNEHNGYYGGFWIVAESGDEKL